MFKRVAYPFLGFLLLASLSAPAQADPELSNRPLTTSERNMVEDALQAYSLRIDPEYYLSGEYLEDTQARTPEIRKRRQQHRQYQLELRKRREAHLQKQIAHREEHRRRVEEHRRKQIEYQTKQRARHIAHLRYRCEIHRRNQQHMQSLARQNPNHAYRRVPRPPGC